MPYWHFNHSVPRQLYFVHQEKTVHYWHFNQTVPSIIRWLSINVSVFLAFQSHRPVDCTLITKKRLCLNGISTLCAINCTLIIKKRPCLTTFQSLCATDYTVIIKKRLCFTGISITPCLAADYTLTTVKILCLTGISITLCRRLYNGRQEKTAPYWHFNHSVLCTVDCTLIIKVNQ